MLTLDYQRKASGIRPAGWLVLLAGILCAGLAIHTFFALKQEKTDLDTTLARFDRKRVPVLRGELSDYDAKRYADDIKLANAIAERLTLPWANLLQAVESGGTHGVALLSLEPDAQKKVLRITAETKDKTDMLAYVRKLTEDQRLHNVHLLEHQTQAQTPGQPVRFSMQATWAAAK